ncbi:hypothetical protein FRB97_008048 [Tulasnella sp. 331]|nr:hypothetical protein FRB97_008048 [Tulasnella sp. 331]KAG8888875.1 hypothetical protein FRB98_006540 [Tulasnella sp. 332]
MLYSAFLLALAAAPALSIPTSSPLKLVSRGEAPYPKGYGDRKLWTDAVGRIKDFEVNLQVTQGDQDLVSTDVNSFVRNLASDVEEGGGYVGFVSTWSDKWDNGVHEYHLLTAHHIKDLEGMQEKIWLDMESAKWNGLFNEIQEIFPVERPADFNELLGEFFDSAGPRIKTSIISEPLANCKMAVHGWKYKTPAPETFTALDDTYWAIQQVLAKYNPIINIGPALINE